MSYYTVAEMRKWKKKPGWRADFKRTSCAYCFFDCPYERCYEFDFYCDMFEPNDLV